ncbi:MAG: methyltransferase domain-containing protein [Pyrinomonadaceae bacterium]
MVFKTRSTEPERIDTGDHTPEEYETFLREIAFINRYLGDARALRRSLYREIERLDLREFSVLDVACGSGELLRQTAELARRSERDARLTGIDLHELSFIEPAADISFVRGDAFRLPFADGSFDYAISSLFFHHLSDEQIPAALSEMSRVARRGVFVIDLERSRTAYYLYKLFCLGFRISPLVTHDGSLSVKKGFVRGEFAGFAAESARCFRSFPFRLILSVPAGASRPSSDG